jgi:hypothetical protein
MTPICSLPLEFTSVCLLSTKTHKKPIASSFDAEVIVQEMWKDKKYFKTNRYICLIALHDMYWTYLNYVPPPEYLLGHYTVLDVQMTWLEKNNNFLNGKLPSNIYITAMTFSLAHPHGKGMTHLPMEDNKEPPCQSSPRSYSVIDQHFE